MSTCAKQEVLQSEDLSLAPKPVVLIYRNELLAPSETFIPAQAEALTKFKPFYVGLKAMDGLALPPERLLVFSTDAESGLGRLRYLRRKLLGPTRQDLERLRVLKPVLIHAHFGIDGALALPIARALAIPLVVTFHGFDATMDDDHLRQTSLAAKLYLRRRSDLVQETSTVVCVSRFIRRAVVAQGYSAERTVVHHIGIDTKIFEPEQDVQREPMVLFVGRLVEKKGCEFLIRAMALLEARGVQAQLIIVGAGPLRSPLEEQAKAVLTKFLFLGHQSAQEIKKLMNRASVFCAPSIVAGTGDSEGFGMVFLEAQSMGVPVVSFDTGGVSEAVEHGATGLLAPSHDVGKLADYISRLLTDRVTWEEFSRQGIQRVRQHFSVDIQTAKLEQIYANLLSGSRTGQVIS